jgi:hypothetical protein
MIQFLKLSDLTHEAQTKLRDQFAAAIMTGLLARGTGVIDHLTGEANLAARAFRLADAMLKERDRETEFSKRA